MIRARHVQGLVKAVLLRPDLWPTAIAAVSRLMPNGWIRQGPSVPLSGTMGPVPSRSYLDYRFQGVYGTPLSQVPPPDVIRYLEWCKAFPGPIR